MVTLQSYFSLNKRLVSLKRYLFFIILITMNGIIFPLSRIKLLTKLNAKACERYLTSNHVPNGLEVIRDLDISKMQGIDYCNRLENCLHDYIFNKLNIRNDSGFLLCVSGGSDSIAMLHLFSNIKLKYQTLINIEIINYNHKIRKESDDEVYTI